MFTHSIRFELAQDVLGALLAHWAEAAAQAPDAVNPDLACLAEIEAEQRKLRNLRADLDPRDAAQIESVVYRGLTEADVTSIANGGGLVAKAPNLDGGGVRCELWTQSGTCRCGADHHRAAAAILGAPRDTHRGG